MLWSKSIKELKENADSYEKKARLIYNALDAMPYGKVQTARPLAERVKEFNLIYSFPKGDDARKMLILDRVGHGMICEAERLRYFAAQAKRYKVLAPHSFGILFAFVVSAYAVGFRSPQNLVIAAIVSTILLAQYSILRLLRQFINLYVSMTAKEELRSSGTEPLWPSTFMCRAGIESVLSGETDDAPFLADVECDWQDIVAEAIQEKQKTVHKS